MDFDLVLPIICLFLSFSVVHLFLFLFSLFEFRFDLDLRQVITVCYLRSQRLVQVKKRGNKNGKRNGGKRLRKERGGKGQILSANFVLLNISVPTFLLQYFTIDRAAFPS